jgi:ring-1,2-phenylacetyl-CoA epoxidase subunit PaaD
VDTPVLEQAAKVLETVCDPEIPVLSIGDLGIIRGLQWNAAEGLLTVTITPTYSGCPAMGIIEAQIHEALGGAGFSKVCVQTVLQPAWTTGWLTEAGREKLRAFGIAPPADRSDAGAGLPALWQLRYGDDLAVWIDGLQGLIPLFGL